MILLGFIYMVNVGLAFVGNFQLSSVLDEFDHLVEGVVSLVEMRYPPRKFACYPVCDHLLLSFNNPHTTRAIRSKNSNARSKPNPQK